MKEKERRKRRKEGGVEEGTKGRKKAEERERKGGMQAGSWRDRKREGGSDWGRKQNNQSGQCGISQGNKWVWNESGKEIKSEQSLLLHTGGGDLVVSSISL